MKQKAWMFSVAMAAALAMGACGNGNDDEEEFIAILSGDNEVPARGTAARGTAGLIYDGSGFRFSIEVDDINSVTQAHIHSGAAGVNGPVRVFLFPAPPNRSATSNPFSTGSRAILSEAQFAASDVVGIPFEQLLAEMRAGTAYVNVHTTQFGGGEIRGQVQLVSRD